MKNRKKALIIAIICLAAAAVLYLLVVKLSQRSEDADSSDDSLVISSVDSGQITAISYEKDGKSLSSFSLFEQTITKPKNFSIFHI